MEKQKRNWGGVIFLLVTLGTILFWPITLLVLQFDLWFVLMLVWTPLMAVTLTYVPDGWEYVAVGIIYLLFTAGAAWLYITHFSKK